ncbi:MAG TPA: anti-sigma factor [Gemmatimonadales bacterium]|jgi:anti-sigma-K factor RskA
MSDNADIPLHELADSYVLGTLDDAERTAFESRLATDEALRRGVAAAQDALGLLAFSAPVAPPPALKEWVLARVAATAPRSGAAPLLFPTPARSRVPLWLGAALAASLAFIVKQAVDLRHARDSNDAASQLMAADQHTLQQRDSLIAELIDPSTETVTLAATGSAKPSVTAYIVRARRTMILSAASLPVLPEGRVYQLWFIVGSKPVPSVTFVADSAGHALLKSVALPDSAFAATAITEEPTGGSPGPTTPPLFVGKLTQK